MSAERSYKDLSEFIRQFIDTCISIMKVLIRSGFSIKLPQSQSETCIVLGNGPSLSTSLQNHPGFIAAHPLMCVNYFATTAEYEKLQPEYYAILDPVFWVEEPEIAVRNCVESLKTKTTWKLHLLLPFQAKRSKVVRMLSEQNPHISISYFNYTVFRGFERTSHFFFRKNLATPQAQNILVACLYLGINIGFKKIHILGADHTWHEQLHVNEQNELCLKDLHFYENAQQTNYRIFYKDATRVEIFKMHEALLAFSKMFSGYHAIRKYAESRNCKIYNSSEVSFIDAFERKKPQE